MDRDFGSIDEAHPDLRKLARLVKSISEIHAGKTPDTMTEMLRRLWVGKILTSWMRSEGKGAVNSD